jgi:hypothetical protein
MAKSRRKPKQGNLSDEDFVRSQIDVFRKNERLLENDLRLTRAEQREFKVAARNISDYARNNPSSKQIQQFLNRGNRWQGTRMLTRGAGSPGQGMGGLGQGGRGGGGSRLTGR